MVVHADEKVALGAFTADDVVSDRRDAARFITGSSNLTRAGLHGQHEFNVEIGDYGTDEAEAYFDVLWGTALPITEYTDTVAHLRGTLEEAFPGQVLAVGSGGITKRLNDRIYANFDAAAPAGIQADRFHVLVASDKLSEGYNLNRAGTVINYDIPWNPTRVIQRVGRINRIGRTVFRELYLYNFFPTEQGADVVHSREIAQQKMFLIHNILGEDAKMFDVDEEPSAAELYKRINRNPEETEEESLLTSVRNRLAKTRPSSRIGSTW